MITRKPATSAFAASGTITDFAQVWLYSPGRAASKQAGPGGRKGALNSVDRETIIDQTKKDLTEWGMLPVQLVSDILDAAEHFELVQKMHALERVAEAARQVAKPKKDIPELLSYRRKLKQVLADLDALGGGE